MEFKVSYISVSVNPEGFESPNNNVSVLIKGLTNSKKPFTIEIESMDIEFIDWIMGNAEQFELNIIAKDGVHTEK